MYTGLLHAHHWLRYIALILLAISLVKAIMNLNKKGEEVGSIKTELYTMISFHIQLLIGMMLLFLSPKVKASMADMGTAMGDSAQRLLLVEHPLVMIIALIVITIGYAKLKGKKDKASYAKTVLIYYGIAGLLVLSRIPTYSWSF